MSTRWYCTFEKEQFVNMLWKAGEFLEDGRFVVDLDIAESTREFRDLRCNRSIGAIKTQINRVKLRLNGIRHQWSDSVARNFDVQLKEHFPHHKIPDEIVYIETGITRSHRAITDYDPVEQQMTGKTVLNNLSGARNWIMKVFDWIKRNVFEC